MTTKVQFKNIIDSDAFRAVLPISVGQDYHEGQKFVATLYAVQKKFTACDIVIADTLQRFNLISKYSSDQAEIQSRLAGDAWLARNQKYIDALTIPSSVIRWDNCKLDPLFSHWLSKLKDYYENNSIYREAVNNDIELFAGRDLARLHDPAVHAQSLAYFLEETAVIFSYFITQKYHYIVYPRRMPSSIQYAREIFTAKEHPNLIQNVEFRFRS